MKTVKRYISAAMAELDRTVLADHGIESVVLNENASCYIPPYAGGPVSIDLAVADEDEERAVEILK